MEDITNMIDCININDNDNVNVNDDVLLIESLNEDFKIFNNKSKKGRKSRQSIMVYQGKRNLATPEPVEENTETSEPSLLSSLLEHQQQEVEATTVVPLLSSVEEELIQQLNNVHINDNEVSTPLPRSSKKAKKTPKSSAKKNAKVESPLKASSPMNTSSPMKTSSSPMKTTSPRKTSSIKKSPIQTMLTTTSLVLPSSHKSTDGTLQTKSLTLKSFSSPKKVSKKQFAKVKVAKSTKTLTIPVTPKFKTDKRMGKKEIAIEKVEPKTTLVDYGPKIVIASEGPKGPTVPQPFQFATDKRITSTVQSTEAVPSVAELAENFMKNARSNAVPKNVCKQLTIANAPHLKSDLRCKSQSRPKPISKEEQDARIMEEYNKIGFKAKPIDKRIFQSQGELGVPKVAAKPCTQPVAFSFNTDKRLGQPVKAVDLESTFKSTFTRPSTTSGPKGPTIPISPKLNVARGQRASSAPARRQNQKYEKPKEVLKYSSPPKLTKPTPFHLATQDRGTMHRASLEEQVLRLKIGEEKLREIHVAPVPKFDHPFQPKHTEKKTQPEEFHLKSVARHEQAVAKFETDIILEESNKPQFHARPVPQSVLNPSFKIEKDVNHVPVVPQDLTFESDRRASKRKEFDDSVAQQKKELHKKKIEDEKLKADQENQEINILRRKSIQEGGLMFKAQPIITKDLYPSSKPKTVPLTNPMSPKFISKMSRA